MLGVVIFVRLLRDTLRYGYAFLNARRLIFLKVLLPRGDGKNDREIEKELAKDMKEKIGRMSQVFNNLHKMSDVTVWEKVKRMFFGKQKLIFITQYQHGQISFLVGTYPEYQDIVESAIASQYASASIERVTRPKFFNRKYYDVQVLETTKDPLYTIKLYKNMPDDPMNNILDSMGKVAPTDSVSIVLVSKPENQRINARRQIAADRLYKNLDIYEKKWWSFKNILNPFKWVSFLLSGPGEDLVRSKKEEENVTMVRMVKAKEDSRNAMGEEAANPTFRATLTLIASSDEEGKPKQILNNLEAAYNVYTDEYSNALAGSNTKHDLFGWLFKSLWQIGVQMYLMGFFSKYSYFSSNEMSGLFHFPDGTYNRAPAIEWMQYKVVAPPSNLPSFSDQEWNGKLISGQLAERYKKGKLSAILDDYPHHWAVGERIDLKERLVPIEELKKADLAGKEVIVKDGKQYVNVNEEVKVKGYKTYKNGVLL